jgi:predicted Zn finger-like uncharacterized protein
MILTCPNCGTQYVVKDGAIPPEGRQVRCAACKHSWHQDPEIQGSTAHSEEDAGVPSAAEAEAASLAEQQATDESLVEATLIEPRSGPEAEERAYEEATLEAVSDASGIDQPAVVEETLSEKASSAPPQGAIETTPAAADWREPPVAEDAPDMFNPFAEDEFQPRRRGRATAVLIALLVIIAAAATFWVFAPPALKAKLGLAGVGSTPLQLVTTHMDRQHLESGNDLLTLTGRVINPSGKEQSVPPIQAQLKNRSGKVVYSWTIQPPAQTLPAGGSASFNSAEVSVPPGGDELTITLGDGKA